MTWLQVPRCPGPSFCAPVLLLVLSVLLLPHPLHWPALSLRIDTHSHSVLTRTRDLRFGIAHCHYGMPNWPGPGSPTPEYSRFFDGGFQVSANLPLTPGKAGAGSITTHPVCFNSASCDRSFMNCACSLISVLFFDYSFWPSFSRLRVLAFLPWLSLDFFLSNSLTWLTPNSLNFFFSLFFQLFSLCSFNFFLCTLSTLSLLVCNNKSNVLHITNFFLFFSYNCFLFTQTIHTSRNSILKLQTINFNQIVCLSTTSSTLKLQVPSSPNFFLSNYLFFQPVC